MSDISNISKGWLLSTDEEWRRTIAEMPALTEDQKRRAYDDAKDAEALSRVLKKGIAALNEEQRKAHDDAVDRDFRELLERRYAPLIERHPPLATSTRTRYLNAFKTFHKWCTEAQASSMPARVGTVGLYLHAMICEGASAETIRLAVASISYCHGLKEEFDPTKDELIKAMVRADSKEKKLNGTAQSISAHL